jgi:hypothetical protein
VSLSLAPLYTTCFGLHWPSAAHNTSATKNDSEHVMHIKKLYFRQQTIKKQIQDVQQFEAILIPDDGQCRPKHVVCRRRRESDTQLVMKVLKFVLYFIIGF